MAHEDGQPHTPGSGSTTTTTQPRKQGSGGAGWSADDVGVEEDSLDLDDRVQAFRYGVAQGGEADLTGVYDYRIMAGPPGVSPQANQRGEGPHRGGPLVGSRTIGQLMTDPTSWSDAELRQVQTWLYQAGYFDDRYYARNEQGILSDHYAEGRYDQATRTAWSALLRDAVLYPGVSLRQLLSERQTQFLEDGVTANGRSVRSAMVGGGNVYTVTKYDEAQLEQMADEIGQEVLGRKPDAEVRARIVAKLQMQNVGQQQAANQAREGADRQAFDARRANADASLAAESGAAGGGSDGGVDQFMAVISGVESGGNYNAVNPDSGASGRFQIMPSNWKPWATEAGLGPNAPRTPENQDRVARFKMQQYYNQFGNWGAVAVAWYAGPDDAAEWLRNPGQARFTRRQGGGKYPSINDYAQKAIDGMGGASGTTTPAPTVAGADTYIAPVTVTQTDIDPAAQAEKDLREAHPDEAGAHDLALVYDRFRGLLGRSTGLVNR